MVIHCTLESSVVDWVIDHPETAPVLQSLAIDCSCGGRSLDFACRERGLDPQVVLSELLRVIKATQSSGATHPS